MKNELGIGGKAPKLQQSAYFIKMQKGKTSTSPLLLVTVVGCEYFQVFGAVWNGHTACIDPLTEPLSLLYVPYATSAIEKLAGALYALHETIEKLGKQKERWSIYPYFDLDNKLTYTKKLKNRVWKAKKTTPSGTQEAVVVKFVKRYVWLRRSSRSS